MTSVDASNDPGARIAARLDRLPVSRWHWVMIVVVGLGAFFDLYEIFLGGVLGAVLTEQWHLDGTGKALAVSSGFIGMFIGAIALGIAADRFGRRRMFLINLGVYAVFSLATAASPNLAVFVVLRIFGGLALGAELTLIDTYLSEFLPRFTRGRHIAYAYTFGFIAVPIAALLGGKLVAGQHLLIAGWRWLLIFGALGAVIVWLLRRALPESPRWLVAHGRADEADAVVSGIEETVRRQTGRDLPDARPVPAEPEVRSSLAEMFRGPYRKRTVMLWIFQILQTVGYYGFGSLAPIVLTAKGYDVVESLGYAALTFIGYPIGSALSIPMMERFERKFLIIYSALAMAVLGLVFAAAAMPWLIVVAGFLLTCASNVFSNAFHTYQAEIFPTAMRSAAISIPYSLSRATSAVLPFAAIALLEGLGPTAVFVSSAVLMVVLCVDVAALGPRSTGRSLEVVAHTKEPAEQAEPTEPTGPAV